MLRSTKVSRTPSPGATRGPLERRGAGGSRLPSTRRAAEAAAKDAWLKYLAIFVVVKYLLEFFASAGSGRSWTRRRRNAADAAAAAVFRAFDGSEESETPRRGARALRRPAPHPRSCRALGDPEAQLRAVARVRAPPRPRRGRKASAASDSAVERRGSTLGRRDARRLVFGGAESKLGVERRVLTARSRPEPALVRVNRADARSRRGHGWAMTRRVLGDWRRLGRVCRGGSVLQPRRRARARAKTRPVPGAGAARRRRPRRPCPAAAWP